MLELLYKVHQICGTKVHVQCLLINCIFKGGSKWSEWEKASGHNALRTGLVALSSTPWSDILLHQYTHLGLSENNL